MNNEIKDLYLVSVYIPAYNHEKYVAECIKSVLNQDYKNIELIIINDGSKDKTDEVIRSYEEKCKDRFVRFEYRNRENKGLSATLNEIVAWSEGKYFTGVASDDVMLPNKISLLANKLENLDENYAAVFGDAIFMDDDSNELYLDVKTGMRIDEENGVNKFLDYFTFDRNIDYHNNEVFGSYETLLAGNYLPAMSYVVKLDKLREVGAWTNGNTIEDWELWLKLSKNYKFAYIDQPVALYRWHEYNSCKQISKNILYDSIKILKDNKNYAISRNLQKIYYENLVNSVIAIKRYSYKDFFLEIIKHLKNFIFMRLFFTRIIEKLIK